MPVLQPGQKTSPASRSLPHREHEKWAFPSKSKSTYGREPARRTMSFTLPPRPFLRPAIEAQVPAFEAELDAGLDRLLASMARAARRRAG